MSSRLLVVLLLSIFCRMTFGAGFEDGAKRHDMEEKDRMMAIVGKTFWVYYGRESCRVFPQLYPEPNLIQSGRFVSDTPAKVYIEGLVVDKNQISRFYKVLINDSDTAYEYVIGSKFLEVKDDGVDDYHVQRECVLAIPPNEMSIRIEKINAKKRDDEKLDAKTKGEDNARHKKPGAKIGMTKKQVIEKTSWGEPDSINTTTTTHGSTEQWVYGDGNYLYFTNGRLTAIQN